MHRLMTFAEQETRPALRLLSKKERERASVCLCVRVSVSVSVCVQACARV